MHQLTYTLLLDDYIFLQVENNFRVRKPHAIRCRSISETSRACKSSYTAGTRYIMENKRQKAATAKVPDELPLSPMSYPNLSGYESPYVESDTDTSSQPIPASAAKSKRRTSSVAGVASCEDTSSPISERSKRAKRRASTGICTARG